MTSGIGANYSYMPYQMPQQTSQAQHAPNNAYLQPVNIPYPNVPVQAYQAYSSQVSVPQIPPAYNTYNSAPLSNIPVQPDVLNLDTQPQNMVHNSSLANNPNSSQNVIKQPLEAQMPAPNIQKEQREELQTQDTTAENTEETEEKPLPSLNIGVVDAPNNASLTPILDDINSRAQDVEKSYLPEIKSDKSINSPVPTTSGKKSFNSGKLSAYLMFGSLGLISLMIIPKGISKIAKIIKHK